MKKEQVSKAYKEAMKEVEKERVKEIQAILKQTLDKSQELLKARGEIEKKLKLLDLLYYVECC